MSECNRMKTELNFSELSVDSSTDMSDSMFSSNLSPIPNILRGRKLNFNSSDNDDCDGKVSTAPMSFSPPYKRVSALTLFDSPRTPKTVLEKCSTPSLSRYRMRLFPSRLDVPAGMPSGSSHYLHPPSFLPSMDDDSAFISLANDEVEEPKPPRQPLVNINPFTPDGQAMNKNKRVLSKTPNGDLTPENPVKRVRLRESNISRYNVEFQELGVIGRGSFGRVTKCLNKLDGCVYALKRSIRPVAGSFAERAAVTEVYAHAALGKHSHVVRYYSAWAEDDHMIIQNEYCDGGSLQQKLEQGPLPESELLLLLAHISDGLSYIHSMRLVHMDLKPGNIFICREEVTLHTDSDDGYEDEDAPSRPSKHKYKIGDLGHVTCISSPKVEEGDCRYLPKEILQEDFSHLTKADIFAFGLTLFEAAGGGELPKNGQYWHDIRDGKVPKLPNISKELYELIKKMIDPNPLSRPSAVDLRRHSVLKLFDDKSKDQLYRELAEAKVKNELLTRQLEQAARCIKSLTPNLQESSIRTRASKRLARHENIDEVIRSVTVTPFHNRVKPGAKNTRETRCNKSLTPSKETGSRTRTSKRLQPRQADGVATSPRTLCSTVATRKLGNRI